MNRIKAIVMDVDGTLTDGAIYMGEHGEVMKRFDIKDGYAIHNMMPEMGITPIVITGRTSNIVMNRCRELGISYVKQGCRDKAAELKSIVVELGLSMEEVAYIGDDIGDIECMKLVGIAICPNDAVEAVKNICDYISECPGGHGVVREFVECIKKRYSGGTE